VCSPAAEWCGRRILRTGRHRREIALPRADAASKEASPHQPIRRFDVFAEYTRQERHEKGFPEDQAKGYGIWLAKVVALVALVRHPPLRAPSRRRSGTEPRRSPNSARWGTSCKRMRPSTTTSSSGWARGSTTRSLCPRSAKPGRTGSPTRPSGTPSAVAGNPPARHRGNRTHQSASTVRPSG
jgi:hypothetical protein